MDKLLECNTIWNNYLAENTSSNFVPRLDAVKELEHLEKAAIHNLNQNSPRIEEGAHRLIASSFFFGKDAGSMKAMGEFLRGCLGAQFEHFFAIEEQDYHERNFRVIITETIISDMCCRGTFLLGRIRIQMSKELAVTTISLALQNGNCPHSADALLPISGFPRELVTEEGEFQVPTPKPKALHPRSYIDEFRSPAKSHRFPSFRERRKLEKRSLSVRGDLRALSLMSPQANPPDARAAAVRPKSPSPSAPSLAPPSTPNTPAPTPTPTPTQVPAPNNPFSPADVDSWARSRAPSQEAFIGELEA
ncbi:hypothetical protein F5Y14DRAFT_448087 [Nemania sp. NC0429]|nr:hypothetical protein F5Y14DRAFT_448087 [Nemania sp. NC0429]